MMLKPGKEGPFSFFGGGRGNAEKGIHTTGMKVGYGSEKKLDGERSSLETKETERGCPEVEGHLTLKETKFALENCASKQKRFRVGEGH